MLGDLELMNIHVKALFTQNGESRLLFENEPGVMNTPAPRLFVGRTGSGSVRRYRADLPEELCDELEALCGEDAQAARLDEAPTYLDRVVRLLEQHAPVAEISSGPAYCFTGYRGEAENLLTLSEKDADILRGGFEELIPELPAWQPFIARIEDGRAVSVCRSARIAPEAHEAGVETLPDFRGRGYAGEVAAEWARVVARSGAIPLYSTSRENTASQGVARKLGLRFYGADLRID